METTTNESPPVGGCDTCGWDVASAPGPWMHCAEHGTWTCGSLTGCRGRCSACEDQDRREHGRGLFYDATRELTRDEWLNELSQVLDLDDLDELRRLITGDSGLSEADKRRIAHEHWREHGGDC